MRSSSLDTFCAPVEGLAIPAQTCEEELLISQNGGLFWDIPKVETAKG